MKNKYRFVGLRTEYGARKLTVLGEVVELDDEEAMSALGPKGLPVLENSVFESVGFTAEELAQYGTHGQRMSAPAAFLEKFEHAQSLIGAQKVEVVE